MNGIVGVYGSGCGEGSWVWVWLLVCMVDEWVKCVMGLVCWDGRVGNENYQDSQD